MALGGSLLWATAARSAPAPACAKTTEASAPAAAAQGAPCWTEVNPYPFGFNGDPVDPVAGGLRLTVDSTAFRAWNRGLAATSGSTAFGVWLFNGTRWFPDPTFPGRAVCSGNKVLWAGKLDYWLVGSQPTPDHVGRYPDVRNGGWPPICRFDGVNFAWVPLSLPEATLARARFATGDGETALKQGAITSGACLAWNDCWFFGDYGAVVRWDGNALTDASPDIVAGPWLATDYTSAIAGSGGPAGPSAFAVGTSGGIDKAPSASQAPGALPARPDGSPPPQASFSSGGPFAPISLPIPSDPQPGDPSRTNLVAVDTDADGRGWVAGNPVGAWAGFETGVVVDAQRRVRTAEPAPLIATSGNGPDPGCPGPSRDRFTYMPDAGATESYAWSSLAVFPGTGAALAGGWMRPLDGGLEPVLVRVTCGGAVSTTRFRVPGAPLVPANPNATITSVAANAVNDAWAATTAGPQGPQRLYRLTDGGPPLAAAGDDAETRPLDLTEDPPRFIDAPPEPEPPAPVRGQTIVPPTPPKTVRLKAPIYAVSISKHPKRIGQRRFVLYVTFRVRRPVTIGVQALRRRTVVSTSGLKRFTGKRGRLALKLDTRHWPTRLRFVTPKASARGIGTPPVRLGGRP
jgi:hypothetical protein